MDLYKGIIRSFIVPLWAFKENTPYLKFLDSLEKSQYYSKDRLKEIQFEKLKKLLNHAYENSPYYKKLFDKKGIDPNITTFNDIKRIPFLTKKDIRENVEELKVKDISKYKKVVDKSTSGSTGVSLNFVIDFMCNEYRRASTIRHDSWTGWNLSDRKAAIWGNPAYKKNWRLFLRNLLLHRCTYLDTLNMYEKDMLIFAKKLLKLKPTMIFGHAHSIYLFSKFVEEKNIKGINPKGIVSSAMVLHEWQREKIENVFNCKVLNRYGCEELGLVASECNEQMGLHVNMESVYVEIIKDNKDAGINEEGNIVVTDLVNYGMPFIRYKVGDLGVVSGKECSCKRGLTLIDRIVGRDADYVVTPLGKYISGISLTENFSLKIPGVEQMQIVQDKVNELRIRIVKDEKFNKNSEEILNNLSKKIFGNDMFFKYEYVNEIKREPSGKYKFVISNIEK